MAQKFGDMNLPQLPKLPKLYFARLVLNIFMKRVQIDRNSIRSEKTASHQENFQINNAISSRLRYEITSSVLKLYHQYAYQMMHKLSQYLQSHPEFSEEQHQYSIRLVVSVLAHQLYQRLNTLFALSYYYPPVLCYNRSPEQYCFTYYSIYNHTPQTSWTGGDYFDDVFASDARDLISNIAPNDDNNGPETESLAPSSPTAAVSPSGRNKTIHNGIRLSPPQHAAPYTSLTSPIPPYGSLNTQRVGAPSITSRPLFVRDVLTQCTTEKDSEAYISSIEQLTNILHINQYYLHFLGIANYLTIDPTTGMVQLSHEIPSYTPLIPPCQLYYTILPSAIRYAPLILTFSRAGFLEATHFNPTMHEGVSCAPLPTPVKDSQSQSHTDSSTDSPSEHEVNLADPQLNTVKINTKNLGMLMKNPTRMRMLNRMLKYHTPTDYDASQNKTDESNISPTASEHQQGDQDSSPKSARSKRKTKSTSPHRITSHDESGVAPDAQEKDQHGTNEGASSNQKPPSSSRMNFLHPHLVFTPIIPIDNILRTCASLRQYALTQPLGVSPTSSPSQESKTRTHESSTDDSTPSSTQLTPPPATTAAVHASHIPFQQVPLTFVWGRIRKGLRKQLSTNPTTPAGVEEGIGQSSGSSGDLSLQSASRVANMLYSPQLGMYGATCEELTALLPPSSPPAVQQSSPRTTAIGDKAYLTVMLSRFNLFFTRFKPFYGRLPLVTSGASPRPPSHPINADAYPWLPETYILPLSLPVILTRLALEAKLLANTSTTNTEHACCTATVSSKGVELTINTVAGTCTPSMWIFKPSNGSSGKGIRVLNISECIDTIEEMQTTLPGALQTDSDIKEAHSDASHVQSPSAHQELIQSPEHTTKTIKLTHALLLQAQELLQNTVKPSFFIPTNTILCMQEYIQSILTVVVPETPADEQINPNASTDSNAVDDDMNSQTYLTSKAGSKYVLSTYITPPLLLKQRKFDLRIYVNVASLSPLVIYVHRLSLVRVCTDEYDDSHTKTSSMIVPQEHENAQQSITAPSVQPFPPEVDLNGNPHHSDSSTSSPSQQQSMEQPDIGGDDPLEVLKKQKKQARFGQLTNFSLNRLRSAFTVDYRLDDDGTGAVFFPNGDNPQNDPTTQPIFGKSAFSRLTAALGPVGGPKVMTEMGLLITRTCVAMRQNGQLKTFIEKYQHEQQEHQADGSCSSRPMKNTNTHEDDHIALSASSLNPTANIFALLGFDIMIDNNHQCWLAEVNTAPSLDIEALIDSHTKMAVVQQALDLSAATHKLMPPSLDLQDQDTTPSTSSTPEQLPLQPIAADNACYLRLPVQNDPHTTPLPAEEWNDEQVQVIAWLEQQQRHRYGFLRLMPSQLDPWNIPYLFSENITVSEHHENAMQSGPLLGSIYDYYDKLIYLWKQLPAQACVDRLNIFLKTSPITVSMSIPEYESSSLHETPPEPPSSPIFNPEHPYTPHVSHLPHPF